MTASISKRSLKLGVAFAALLGAGLTLAAPEFAVAGAYEDALAVVEAVYGPVGDTNTAGPGSLDWRVIGLTISANQLKIAGNDDEALAKISAAANLVQSSQ